MSDTDIGFDAMEASYSLDEERARSRRAAVSIMKDLVSELAEHGFHPSVTCMKNDDSSGLIMLTLDLGIWGEKAGQVGPAGHAAPEPEQGEPSADVAARADAPTAAPSAPDKAEDQVQDEADLVTGPIEGEERDLVISLFAAGQTPTEIAKQLNRKTKQLNNFRYRNRDEIEAAINGPGNPEPETKAEAARLSLDARRDLTVSERAIDNHLNAVGYADGWSPMRDLRMADLLSRGDGAGAVAEDLGVEKAAVIQRWKLINQDPVSIDHQHRLVRVLGLRAEGVAQVAE